MKKISVLSTIIILAFLVTGLNSCKKDNETLLTDGIWNFENITTDSVDESIQTIVAGFKAAYTDATLQFFSDGTYVIEYPLIDDETGTWELAGSSKLIFTPDGGGLKSAVIEDISGKELVYLETFVDTNSNPFNTTTTWVK